MPGDVKPRRRYQSRRREQQAEATRQTILEAGRDLFTTKGWTATTIAAIARRAGVATETVYARFGNKRAIVHELVVASMRGDDRTTPFMEQAARRRVQEQSDPARMVEAIADDLSGILPRVAPVLAVVRTAAESDAEMRDLYAELHTARRRNLSRFVSGLAAIGGLRPGLDVETATDHVWSLASPELFLVWTRVGERDAAEHRDWIAQALTRLLLKEA